MRNIKEINIKNGTYYFFDYMINIKNFDSNSIKTDKKSYKNFDIYYIEYFTMKDSDYVKIYSVNPLYLTISEVDGSIEKKWKQILNFCFYGQKQRSIGKVHRAKIKNLIEKIDNKPGEYGKDYMKIKSNSDDNLPLNKLLKLYMLTIIVRSVFKDVDKYHLQIF